MLYSRTVHATCSLLPRSILQLSRACARHASSAASVAPAAQRAPSKVDGDATAAAAAAKPTLNWPPSSAFASYRVGIPPTPAQLRYANRYFETGRPEYLLSAESFRVIPGSDAPEVAFIGRSNVGKSSLLNALLHRTKTPLAIASKTPGRTREMNAYGVNVVRHNKPKKWITWVGRPNGLVVMDMPGYGKGSQVRWGEEITKYLTKRKQLRRVFFLVDSEHGVKKNDTQMLDLLRSHQVPYQVVATKIDKIVLPRGRDTVENVTLRMDRMHLVFNRTRYHTGHHGREERDPVDVLTCSSEWSIAPASQDKIGIDHLRWAVLCAAGLESDKFGNPREIEYDILPPETAE